MIRISAVTINAHFLSRKGDPVPNDSLVVARASPEWFVDSPLGIMVHWGAYSVPAWAETRAQFGELEMGEWLRHCAYAEWYANSIRLDGTAAQRHHAEVWGARPYEDFLDLWEVDQFDPADWMDLFVRAGAGYVVPTTKHHDGFGLWDAPGTGVMNTVNSGPRRDLISELSSAARERGIRVGLYYSGGIDWLHRPGPPDDGVIDHHPQDQGYALYAARQVHDLVDRFAPDMLWNDIGWPKAGFEAGPASLADVLEHLYRRNPEAVINDRFNGFAADYRTSEYRVDAAHESSSQWENCRGIGTSFGFNQVEGPESHLSGPQAARYLVDVVARGGHFLLNVGPTASGLIPDLQRRCLEGLAAWMVFARPFLNLRGTQHPIDEGAFVRRVEQPDGVAVFLDDQDAHVLDMSGYAAAEPIHGVSDLHQVGTELRVTLDADRLGPAIVTLR